MLRGSEEKVSQDPLGVLDAESGYYQYRKYHVLSLRKDKIFNLHKNIVVNTEQVDENLLPANEIWEGYGGIYSLWLLRNYFIKDPSIWCVLSIDKLLKLVSHTLCSVPENMYTGGDYFLAFLEFI